MHASKAKAQASRQVSDPAQQGPAFLSGLKASYVRLLAALLRHFVVQLVLSPELICRDRIAIMERLRQEVVQQWL